jgi:hypothetical protein
MSEADQPTLSATVLAREIQNSSKEKTFYFKVKDYLVEAEKEVMV